MCIIYYFLTVRRFGVDSRSKCKIKPQWVIRTHLLRFVIACLLPYCFSQLADIFAAITSRRSPICLR